jgi:hypothetical protein
MSQLALANPLHGSIIRHTSNELLAMIGRADVLVRSGHPELAKQAGKQPGMLAERFVRNCL